MDPKAKEILDYLDSEASRYTLEALDSIANARKELDFIELQLVNAYAGRPYLRIGEIRQANAGTIFSAFGAVERFASLRSAFGIEEPGDPA